MLDSGCIPAKIKATHSHHSFAHACLPFITQPHGVVHQWDSLLGGSCPVVAPAIAAALRIGGTAAGSTAATLLQPVAHRTSALHSWPSQCGEGDQNEQQ